MNTHKNPVRNILSVAALTLCLTAPVALADSVGEVSYHASGFSVLPALGQKVAGYQLVVSGPNDYRSEQTFKGSELPAFDAAGLADGVYNYELAVIPAKQISQERKAIERVAQSGAFSIQGGSVVDQTLAEGALEKAQTYTTDLIVNGGSMCVGFDCANGESFGSDTFRLKENNLRIHFDDTSASASFPNNDWRLTANDTSNGGANRFSIDDATANRSLLNIEAGAPANSVRIDAAGNIGIKTANPVLELHAVNGNSPTLRLEQDGSSGFTPQTFDLSGNEANFFIRDVTNGSKLPFRIKPGAGDNLIFLAADESIGIGTASPSASMHVRRADSTAAMLIEDTNSATVTDELEMLHLKNNGAVRMSLSNTDNGDNWVFIGPQSNNNLVINNTGNSGNEFDLTEQGSLTIAGGLTINGNCNGCDAVFSADWPLESIKEHAEQMWANQYLPAVGPTQEGTVSIDIFEKTTGMLQELEKAHIYIEQLHTRLESKKSRLAELTEILDEVEAQD